MGRAKFRTMAAETLRIVDEGRYHIEGGGDVSIAEALRKSVDGTIEYTPEELEAEVADRCRAMLDTPSGAGKIEVTDETTMAAMQRLIEKEQLANPAALNFASAKNPGGGFLNGAVAQEECLARSSTLYASLSRASAYYAANRACGTPLYTDHLIYSPNVAFFRDDAGRLLDRPYEAAVLTSPAPNAGVLLQRQLGPPEEIASTLRRRGEQVLSVAAVHRHRAIVLGAWGCGVFRNDPGGVADAFRYLLLNRGFICCFDRVVFAVFDPTADRRNLRAFQSAFELA